MGTAGSKPAGVFRSTNGGESWKPFSQGLEVLEIGALAIDSAGRALHAGTRGGGVIDFRFVR